MSAHDGSEQGSPTHRFPPGPLLRHIDELDDPGVASEEALRLADARVLFADHALLQHDFPQLRPEALVQRHPWLAGLSEHDRHREAGKLIEQWLLRNAGFISANQVKQARVNTPIRTTGERVTAYRPPRYGRSIVVSVHGNHSLLPPDSPWLDEPDGLLDLKGAGVSPQAVPRQQSHSNGLFYLGRALADLVFQWVIDEVFRRAVPYFWTVPVYGVLDLGFDVKRRDVPGATPTTPAGMLIRRAHRRFPGGVELPRSGSDQERLMFQIEMLLRHYGITSSNDGTWLELAMDDGRLKVSYGGEPATDLSERQLEVIRRLSRIGTSPLVFEGINIQMVRDYSYTPQHAQLFDFGQYRIRPSFDNPVMSLVRNRVLRWGSAMWPGDPHFVQPHPDLAISYERWGRIDDWKEIEPIENIPFGEIDSTPIMAMAYNLTRRYRAGKLSGQEVRSELEALVSAMTEQWAGCG